VKQRQPNKPTPPIKPGQIVVARLHDEVTVKRIRQRRDVVELVPENPSFKTIVVDLKREDPGRSCPLIVRELDNPLIDALINRYRCLSGGRAVEKREAAREVLRAFQRGEAVGILADQNMLLPDGVFVKFFGLPACTTPAPHAWRDVPACRLCWGW
jgi:hypothetical protein